MLKKTIVLSLFLAFAVSAGAAPAPMRPALWDDCATPGKDGSPPNLSGVVNTYWTVSGSLAAGATQMVVGAASGATAVFPNITAGDLLLVIQMQDAAIDFDNDGTYGDGTTGRGSNNIGTANAGHYEYVQVTNVSPSPLLVGAGGTITFEGRNGVGLIRNYVNANSTGTAGQKRFQVIRVPQYDTVTMNATTPVTCAPWDGQRGGIVVMDVRNTLNFNNGGSVDVTGMGFRGGGGMRQTGAGNNSGFFNTDYRTITQDGGGSGSKINGSKGEGYAGTSRLVYIKSTNTVVNLTPVPPNGIADDFGYPAGSSGRGAPGNAGGGGTDGDPANNGDNTGGGGGGNGGQGGQGGDAGNVRVACGGLGGAAFPFTAGRVVLGGGGGAGSRKATPEDASACSGGPGGGIVLIRAFEVAANPGTVTANGDVGYRPEADAGNGGGGGGAGGSIVFTVLSGNLSTLTLNANGGAGTDATWDQPTLLMGPGGGGAGGVILTSAAALAMNATPGAAGDSTVANDPYGATAGATGARSGVGPVGFILPSDIPGVQSGAECSAISIGNVTVTEGNAGTILATFTVTNPSGNAADVTWNTADGTATDADNDYEPLLNQTLSFALGETSKQIQVTVNGDLNSEPNETFTVTLSNPTNGARLGNATGTGTITTDDAALSISSVTAAETNGNVIFSFTVTLSNTSPSTITARVDTADGTAAAGSDYTAIVNGLVSFAPGETSKNVDVTVTGDTAGEAHETFTVVLSNPTNATIASGTGTGTIQNDDSVLSVDSVSIVEGNAGSQNLVFTVSLDFAHFANVTVNHATTNGTAVAPGDYTAIPTTLLTFAPGETTKSVTVVVNGDTTPEPHETFTVDLTVPTNATIGTAAGTGTIQNDESGISINDVSAVEGNSLTFTVTLDFPSVNTVTVDFATANDTATVADSDYTASTNTVSFAPGVTTQPVIINSTGDAKNEADETFFVNLNTPTGGGTITDGQGVGTITNDDAVPTLSINDVSAAEGDGGTTTFTFTVTLSAASGQTVTVNFTTADGTAATADNDYVATNGTLTFVPGDTSEQVQVTVNGDLKNEADEGFVVNLTSPNNASFGDNQGAGTITNDDVLPTIAIDDIAANEGNSGTTAFTFTVTLLAVSGQTVTVDFATAPGTAAAGSDYATATGTVTFNPGETTKPVTVDVTGEFLDEANETFFVNLTNPSNATIADNQGQGTIQNDDSNPTINISNASVVEGNSGTATLTFTVTLSAVSGQNVTVNFATADGTATLADNDYVANSGTLTFTPGQTSQPVTVTVNGDTADELTETVLVNLSGASGGTVGTSPGTGSIVTDDIPADLRVVKTVSNGFPGAGDTITYTLTINYTGPTDATNVTLVDKLPADVTFGSATPSQGTFDPVSGVWAAGTVPIDGTASLTIQVTVNAGTWGQTIVNSVTVGSDVQNDVNPTNNQSSVSIVVVVPELVIQFAGAPAGVVGVDSPPVTLPPGTEGAFYQQQAFATGGLPQFHWSVVSSTPPFPFNLDPDTGVFSGTAAAGTYNFRLGVTDAQNPTASDVRDFTVTINAPGGTPDINVLPAPPNGMVGTAYSHPFTATGGQPPYSWSVGAGLPPGLLLNPSTGIVAGTPTAAGSFNFTVTVTDSAAAVDSQAFTIDILPVPVTIVTTSLPPGSEGSVYSQQIEAEGGIGPGFTWSVTAGTIPPGTTLVGNSRIAVLSGTPIAAGTYVFTVQASDNSQVSVTDTQVLIVLVSASGTQPLITTSSIPEGTVTISYSAQLTAAGGLTPYAWSLVAGTLPAGLTLNSATGLISGVPTESGVFQIIVQVADSTTPPQFDTQELTLTIWTLPNIVTPSPLPNALLNAPYSVNLNAVGGKPPLAWSLIGGGLPAAGLSFSTASGSVNGLPNTATTVSFTARITDANGFFDEQLFQVTILDPSILAIVTNTLPRGIVGVPYSQQMVAVGGTTPYAWSSTGVPAGLTLNATTGVLSGTPTSAANVTITFTVTDAPLATASRAIDLRIEGPLQITTVKLPDGSPNVGYDSLLESTGGTAPTFWEIMDATIPPGLSLAASTGAITGVPPQAGTWTFLVQVTDEDGHTSQKLFTIVIRPFGRARFNAGYCGLTGLEILVPLGALWLYRRRRSGRRTLPATLSAFLAVAVLGAAPSFADEDRWLESYRTMSLQEPKAQEEKPEAKPAAAPAAPQGEDEPFFQSWEAAAHLGFVAFSSEFEADPEFGAGLSLRASLPWFSKTVLGLDEPMVGMFLDFTFSSIDRDIAVLPEPDGTLIFFTIGLDLTAYKDETWVIRPQLGLQYGHFGGVTDLDNGIALLLGVEVGVSFAENWRVFFNPQVGIGEDMVFFLPLGVAVSF